MKAESVVIKPYSNFHTLPVTNFVLKFLITHPEMTVKLEDLYLKLILGQ